MQIENNIPHLIPGLYAKLNSVGRETTITEAGSAVLDLLDRIRQAECNPKEYRKFEAWRRLQREVDWLYDENEPVPGSDPQTTAVARIVVDWMKQC